jgi:hypothetical protein
LTITPLTLILSLKEGSMSGFFKKIWSGIKIFSRKVAYVQSLIILTLFYFLVIGPFSIALRVFGKDLLNKRWKDKKSSYWIKKERAEVNLENARRQF